MIQLSLKQTKYQFFITHEVKNLQSQSYQIIKIRYNKVEHEQLIQVCQSENIFQQILQLNLGIQKQKFNPQFQLNISKYFTRSEMTRRSITLILGLLVALCYQGGALRVAHQGDVPPLWLLAEMQDAGLDVSKWLFPGADPIFCSDVRDAGVDMPTESECAAKGSGWYFSQYLCECKYDDVAYRRTSICRALYYKDPGTCCYHDTRICYFKSAEKNDQPPQGYTNV